jgi:hypothetical protein
VRWIGSVLIAAVLVAGCGAPIQSASPHDLPPTSVGAEWVSSSAAATPDGVPGSAPFPRTGGGGASTSPSARESEATAGPATDVAAASSDRTKEPAAAGQAAPTRAVDEALLMLQTLPVKGRAPKTGYDRSLFGAAWTDDVTVDGGHNGCDTRNDILRRDLTGAVIKSGTYGCLVLSGTLHDAYTGKTIVFTRGQVTSQAVQIDHVVALLDAWQKGAQGLSMTERRNLANDPLNLQAVDGPTNERKGAGDAATWLPPNKGYRCLYVSRQVAVKVKYRLWVTQAERDAIERVLASCTTGVTPSTSMPATVAPVLATSVPPETTAQAAITPLATTQAATAASAPQPGDCFPRSKAGNCYNAGQLCAKKSHGESGVAANGRAITCIENAGAWRWTYA